MEWPLADWSKRREDALNRMFTVLKVQAEILSEADSPDFFERWAKLAGQWEAERQEVEEVQRLIESLPDPRMIAESNAALKAGLLRLSALQQKVEDQIILESNRQLREFKAANKQRLGINSYHGFERMEQVALYVDEKK